MPIYHCECCDGMTCTLIVTCNNDDMPITNPDGTCDNIPCMRRTSNLRPVWREMKVVD